MVPVNFLAVLAAAAASFVLGWVWFGPLFGKPWMKAMGISASDIEKSKKEGMGKTMALNAVGTLVMAYVMAHSMVFATTYLNISGVSAGLQGGLWNWLGFMAPVIMGDQLWGGKPWKLFPITAGYYLVSLCLMGVIISLWPAM
ncbi:DUF1761 domain-containing protein [Candidatus Uhrbacteria bacterium]|nr:DUF1761 domain-containing protein [Candidatus Uhrbacteria bacterium]